MKTNRTSAEILKSLAGTKKEFVRALIELTWFRYDFTIADVEYAGKARKHLILGLECAGQTDQENVWVYRLNMPDGTLNDARRAVESQLQQRPEFAVFFVVIRDAIVVAVPASDTKGAHGDALVAGCIPLNTRHPANFEDEMLRRLADAPRNRFKSVLRDITSVEKVTKKFYEEFKKQKDAFITAIKGINDKVKDDSDRKWYASVILDRLMFLYFIQSNGLLNGDLRYLASRLESHAGYYRKFLLPLFFDGLAVDSEKRKSGTNALLGDIPYLNGGLFQQHKLETDYPDIEIADSAFQAIFKFFDQYTWHIDDRPLAVEREINPDVLGFIFEKYVNQKEMGAYYTKEDITGYICRNTIIPRLFDMLAEAGHTIEPLPIGSRDSNLDISEGDGIDRYIYNAVKTTDYLPTETEREYTARRKRYESILQDFKEGKITSVNDFITYNLDIEEMAQDFAAGIRDAGVLGDFYFRCLKKITVLDPTCGSGAFLLAALKILYPLYEACLARMRILCDENPPAPTGTLVGTFAFDNQVARQTALLDIRTISDPVRHAFRQELDRIAEHPNSKYYITKTIIVNNLFGVDIENEAVEICKLRLFLKLASHAEPDATKPNHGIEPLPDIDFNIRAGNTLVGYTSIANIDALRASVEGGSTTQTGTLGYEKKHESLRLKLEQYADLLQDYRAQELGHGIKRKELLEKQTGLDAAVKVRRGVAEDVWRVY